jgi:hypothetical protein
LAAHILTRAAIAPLRPGFDAGPFPLAHPDLHYNNIMVDEHYNITGILYWTRVHAVPQEIFAAIPGFIKPPGIREESKVVAYASCLDLFMQILRKREGLLSDRANVISLSEFVGSDLADMSSKALQRGVPPRAVAYAKLLLPSVLGKDIS